MMLQFSVLNMRLLLGLAILPILACCAAEGLAQSIDLAPMEGDTLHYSRQIKSNIRQHVSGNDIKFDMILDGPMHAMATELRPESIRWSLIAPATTLSLDLAPGGKMEFDTALGSGRVSLETTRIGEITTMSGTLIDGGEAGEVVPGNAGRDVLELLFLPPLPEGVTQGQSWNRLRSDSSSDGSRAVNQDLTYRYDGSVDTLGISTIRVRIISSPVTIIGTIMQSGLQGEFDAAGQIDATMYYSMDDGMLVVATHRSDLKGHMVFNGTVNVPFELVNNIHLRRESASPSVPTK